MWRLGFLGRVGAVAVTGSFLTGVAAEAQYGGYPGGGYVAQGYSTSGYAAPGYGAAPRGISVQVGLGGGGYAPVAPAAVGYQGAYPGLQGGYAPAWSGGAGQRCAPARSPAERQGYREGQLYYETGIAPRRPLSPAEAEGFFRGEQRAAAVPWQLDPARQQGYREGQLYWETGIAPNRPLSPAEAQGFQVGERRASGGYFDPYR